MIVSLKYIANILGVRVTMDSIGQREITLHLDSDNFTSSRNVVKVFINVTQNNRNYLMGQLELVTNSGA